MSQIATAFAVPSAALEVTERHLSAGDAGEDPWPEVLESLRGSGVKV